MMDLSAGRCISAPALKRLETLDVGGQGQAGPRMRLHQADGSETIDNCRAPLGESHGSSRFARMPGTSYVRCGPQAVAADKWPQCERAPLKCQRHCCFAPRRSADGQRVSRKPCLRGRSARNSQPVQTDDGGLAQLQRQRPSVRGVKW
jgi:hypothetical protein